MRGDRQESGRGPRLAGPSSEAPAPELVDAGFAWEIADAPLLHHGLNLADLGHVLDLRNRGLIPQPAAADLLRVLLDAYGTDPDDFPYDSAFGEVYNSRERHFVERIGDSAGWLHAGRPRREAARVALRLLLRSQTARLIEVGADFASVAAAVAADHAETFMGDQTYLQQAQPSTFGHYLLAFVPPALRDGERFSAALEQVNTSPGGAGCVNGSRLLDDRGAIAGDLGFDGVIAHTRDAMWQTDVFIDLLATVGEHDRQPGQAGRGPRDLVEPGVRLRRPGRTVHPGVGADAPEAQPLLPVHHPGGQRRADRPDERVPGRGQEPVGSQRQPHLRLRGDPPGAGLHDPGERPDGRGGENPDRERRARMWSELERGFTQATDLAEYVMVAAGVDYRTAYHVVGRAVRAASREGLRGLDITSEMLDDAASEVCGRRLGLDAAALAEALDPRRIVATRRATGGAAPGEVRSMAEEFSDHAARLRATAVEAQERYARAEERLVARARELAGAP